jgi:hypothetical protein
MEFKREIAMSPAYDKRHPDPNKNYGIGSVTVTFILKGERGAVQFKLGSGWFLPESQKPGISDDYPMAWDKGYHSYIPRYDGQTPITDSCHVLDGKPCYYDGSTLNAEPLLDVLLREGSEGIWRELEQYYKETFHWGEAIPSPEGRDE